MAKHYRRALVAVLVAFVLALMAFAPARATPLASNNLMAPEHCMFQCAQWDSEILIRIPLE